MGKEWDHGVPGIPFWEEALRVCKPGAHLLAFGGTRTHHRLACAIEDAGWEIRDTLGWLYGSGFPKSLDVSKAIDKIFPRIGQFEAFATHFAEQRKIRGLSQKEIAINFPSKTGGLTGCVWNWENAANVPTLEQWGVLQPLLNLSLEYLPLIERMEAEREIVAKNAATKLAVAPGQNNDRGAIELDVTVPATDAAKQWSGWGTALKPAWEPIILARKPLDGTVAKNVQKWGTGALNIDGCRIETHKDDKWYNSNYPHKTTGYDATGYKIDYQRESMSNQKGRFPANLIHDGSEEVLAIFPQTPGQLCRVSGNEPTANGFSGAVKFGGMRKRVASMDPRGDTGSAARFFYCAKADTEERNIGCDTMPKTSAGDCVGRVEGTVGISSPAAGAGRNSGSKNFHPTVKPLSLIRYLCRLITPPGGHVLDMFGGSGTTMLAANEELFNCTIIEINPDYVKIIKNHLQVGSQLDTGVISYKFEKAGE